MALNSFYGGKQGISPVIKATFKYLSNRQEDNQYVDPAYGGAYRSIVEDNTITQEQKEIKIVELNNQTLEYQFNNSSYKDVWFGELGIVDSPNKLDKNNGKLYRRTLQTSMSDQDDKYAGQHAEYIGQIVGPAGQNPYMIVSSESDIQQKLLTASSVVYPMTTTEGTSISTIVPTSTPDLTYFSATPGTELIPGYIATTPTATYNDNIEYTWANIITSTDDPAYVYLGFKVPYSIFDFSITTTDYQSPATITQNNDSINHPFYWKYDLEIPRGIRGIWQEIKIGQTEEWTNTLYASLDSLIYNPDTDIYTIASGASTADLTDIAQFWYLEVKIPKVSGNPDTYYFYLAPYKTLNTVSFNDNTGSITLNYDDNTSITPSYNYRYPTNARYNDQDGSIEINYVGQTPGWFPLTDTATPSNPLYINYIQDIYGTYSGNKNEFYVLYSSEKYRYPSRYSATPSDLTRTATPDGKIWVKDPKPGESNNLWWELLSPLTSVPKSLIIKAQIDWHGYTPTPSFWPIPVTPVLTPATYNQVLSALNTTATSVTNSYLGGKDGYGNDIDGKLLHYYQEYTDNGEKKSVGYSYFYDTIKNEWRYIPSLSTDGSGGSGGSGGSSWIQIYNWDDNDNRYKPNENYTALGFIEETVTSTPLNWGSVIPSA